MRCEDTDFVRPAIPICNVIPAEAGTQATSPRDVPSKQRTGYHVLEPHPSPDHLLKRDWVPAFAGMTVRGGNAIRNQERFGEARAMMARVSARSSP
jgi:hypothetical protein